jgi:hypothetical protein
LPGFDSLIPMRVASASLLRHDVGVGFPKETYLSFVGL